MVQVLENIVLWMFWVMFMIFDKIIYPLLLVILIVLIAMLVFVAISCPIIILIDYIKNKHDGI